MQFSDLFQQLISALGPNQFVQSINAGPNSIEVHIAPRINAATIGDIAIYEITDVATFITNWQASTTDTLTTWQTLAAPFLQSAS